MINTMILDPYATTEKSVTIFEHLPQETGYNFLEQKIEVTSESDKFLELLIKECSRYGIGYEQQGNTLIMVLPVRGYGPIHMILISKAKEAYMKKVKEEPIKQEEEAHMNTMVMEKKEVIELSKEDLIENVKNYTLYSSSSTGVGEIYLKGDSSFAKVTVQERLEEKFVKEFKTFLEEKGNLIIEYKENAYFNDDIDSLEFEIELPGTKEEIIAQDSTVVAKKAVTAMLKEFIDYIKESDKTIVNDNDDSNAIKVSELKGLPLFFESKKPAIEWSKYDNGDAREYFVTKNNHKLYTSKATGSFFKTGQNAYKGQNILVVDLDTDKAGKGVGVQNLMSWARKNMGKDRVSELMSGGVVTPSGGLHLYFTYPDGLEIKSNAGTFLEHVDIRANAGIIVMPGTLAKSDKYEGSKEYILNDKFDTIKPIPKELLDLILSSQKPNYEPPVYSSSAVSLADTSMDNYRVEVWKSIVEVLNGIVEGKRNNTLNSQAYKAGTHCIDEDLAYSEFARILGEKGMGSLEFETTFWKAYQEGRANPRKIEKIEERKNSGDNNTMKNEDDNRLAEKEAQEKKRREFEIASELRNLWEFEHQNVDAYYLKDKKVFIIWDSINNIWVEQESPDTALMEYRRKRITEYEKEAREKGLNIYRSIASIENFNFLTGGTRAIKGYKNRVAADLNCGETTILTENGLLDLRTKTLSPMTKDALFTKKVNASYLGTYEELSSKPEYIQAKEEFEKVIGNFGSKEVITYMRGVLGSGLTTLPSHSTRSYWWYSNGGSGKTTILNILKETFGTYSSKPTGSIFDAYSTSFEMAKLEGSRVALIEEAPVGYLDAARMKSVLGSSTASLANKHEKSRDVNVTWGFHIMTNNFPLIRPEEFDFGTLRRITIVPFLTKHEGDADTSLMTLGKDAKVRELCLSWLVDGCKKWLEDSDYEKDHNLPQEILEATKKWQSRATGESDPLEMFIEENIEENEDYYINAADVFSAYREWCEENNVKLRDNALKTCNKIEEKLKVEFTPKARPQGKKNSHYDLEYGHEFREDENSQKKRLFGFKFTTTK